METITDDVARERLREALGQVARGDRDAFRLVYEHTSAKLFGICLRMLPQRSDAEDVMQDVFVTIWQKARQFDASRASPMTWLISIARNKSIDRLRERGVDQHSGPIDLAGPLADPSPAQDAVTQSAQTKRRLDSCLNTLEPKQRAAIRVAFLEGLTHDALAKRVGVPLGTMKSWIRRGLHLLKACLGDL